MRTLLVGLAAWIAASSPAFAALCEAPGGVGLLNARWPPEKEVTVRLGGYKAGKQDKAEQGLSPLFATVIDALSAPWRYVEAGEVPTLTLIFYRPAKRHPSADAAIDAFFGDNAEEREEFVASLTGDIRMRLLPGKVDIDLSAPQGEPIKIDIPKIMASAPRIVASPVPDNEDAWALLMLRALVLSLAGGNDVLSALECDTYQGILRSTNSLKLSEDDLILLRGE